MTNRPADGGLTSTSTTPTPTSDTWSFDIRSRVWQRLPDAPGPARASTALTLSRGRLYRFGGSDADQTPQDGQLDYLELGLDMFDDQISKGEAVLCAKSGGWKSLLFGKEDVGYKESDPAAKPLDLHHQPGGKDEWPGERTAAAMQAVTVGGGREYLVLMLGEREGGAEERGSEGRSFWDDVWAFQVPAEGMSLASVTDTAFSVVGRKSGEGTWTRVVMGPYDDEDDASLGGPGPRGWVASAPMGDVEENGIVVFGGLGEGERRLGDGWVFRLG